MIRGTDKQQTKQMTNYQELETQIEQLQKEVERLKKEEAEQIDLSTCIMGQLAQLRNGDFEYYEYKDEAGDYLVGGCSYGKNGSYYTGNPTESQYDVVKVFPAEIPVPGAFSTYFAKEVLKGNISYLVNSFGFADTPQGDEYWRNIYRGKTNLSLGDMICIQKWVIQDQ